MMEAFHDSAPRNPLLVAAALFVLMLCVASPLLYHGDNLTFCHALYLNGTPSAHWLHPSYLLSHPLCRLSLLVPWVNVYLLYLYVLLVCSAAAVLHVSRAGGEGAFSLRAAGLLTACYIIFQVPMHMEYAWISFLAAGCGCMLLFSRLYRGETGFLQVLPGLLLVAGGAVLRYDSCLAFAPFIGAAALFCLRRAKTPWACAKGLAAPLAAVVFLLAVYVWQPVLAEKQWPGGGNLVSVNLDRMSFCDYPDRSGADKTAAYTAAGIKPAAVRLLEGYFYSDENTMSPEWWERAARVRRAGNPAYMWGKVARENFCEILACCHNRFLLLTLLAVWGVLIRRGRWRLYPLAMAAAFFLCIFICCAKGRCHLTPIMSLAYFYVPMLLVPCGVQEKWPRFITPARAAWGTAAAIGVTVACILVYNLPQLQAFGGFRHRYEQPEARTDLSEWLQRNPDLIVWADCYVYRAISYPAAPLFNPKAPYIPRLLELGNWPSTLPYRRVQRTGYGIPAEVAGLLSPRSRLLIGPGSMELFPTLLDYLREQYGLNPVLEKELQLTEDYSLYKLTTTPAP